MYLVENKELFPDRTSLWEELRNIDDQESLTEDLLLERILIFPIIKNSNKDVETATNVIASLLRDVNPSDMSGSVSELIQYNSFVVVPTSDTSVDLNQIAHKAKTKDIKMPYEIYIPEALTLDKACLAVYDVFKTALKGVEDLEEPEDLYNWLTTTIVGRIFAKASTKEPDESASDDIKYEWAEETFRYDVEGVAEEVNSSSDRGRLQHSPYHNINWSLKGIVDNAEEYKYLREPQNRPGYKPEPPRMDSVYVPQDIKTKYNIGRHNR
jgi:hypothetical protein